MSMNFDIFAHMIGELSSFFLKEICKRCRPINWLVESISMWLDLFCSIIDFMSYTAADIFGDLDDEN